MPPKKGGYSSSWERLIEPQSSVDLSSSNHKLMYIQYTRVLPLYSYIFHNCSWLGLIINVHKFPIISIYKTLQQTINHNLSHSTIDFQRSKLLNFCWLGMNTVSTWLTNMVMPWVCIWSYLRKILKTLTLWAESLRQEVYTVGCLSSEELISNEGLSVGKRMCFQSFQEVPTEPMDM
jgi:hypothetical protein